MSDNSEKNLLQILRGGEEENEEFLWDVMRDRKCFTYLSEEVGDFPPLLGNISLNVEHDLRPFYKYSKQNNKSHCTSDGRVASHEHIEYWKNTIRNAKRYCHFSMHYMRTYSRNGSEYLPHLDTELRLVVFNIVFQHRFRF
ncbi:hypothetical protein COOONC_21252 [Cooperia oncophora]